jgi:hypothetical protein
MTPTMGGPIGPLNDFFKSQDFRIHVPNVEKPRMQKISRLGELFKKSILGPPAGGGGRP